MMSARNVPRAVYPMFGYNQVLLLLAAHALMMGHIRSAYASLANLPASL